MSFNTIRPLSRYLSMIRNTLRVPVEPRAARGVGCVEAPRGTLFHDYETDGNGILTEVNLLVATCQNNAAINMSVKRTAMDLIKDGKYDEEILFNIALNELKNLKKIIIIDIGDLGRNPGEFMMVRADELPDREVQSFSMHQVPTSSLIHELTELKNIEVNLLLVQPKKIPEEVSQGLSTELKKKLPLIAKVLITEF